jgi:hypothetical protein
MIREKVTVNDFQKIAKENEFFLWHFVNTDSVTQLKSIFIPDNPFQPNPIFGILDAVPIPYFESDSKESYDFLINLDTLFIRHLYKQGIYSPVIIGFNRRRMVTHTLGLHCYCIEGVIDIIGELNPQYLSNFV